MSARRFVATVGVGLALMLASASPAFAVPGGSGPGNGGTCPTTGANASPNDGGCVGHFIKASGKTNTRG
jgi:hypothetical protein